MHVRQAIHTDQAPKAIGPYSQAIRVGDTVYLAGQIPLDPATMQMVEGDFEKEARRVFENIKAVIRPSPRLAVMIKGVPPADTTTRPSRKGPVATCKSASSNWESSGRFAKGASAAAPSAGGRVWRGARFPGGAPYLC